MLYYNNAEIGSYIITTIQKRIPVFARQHRGKLANTGIQIF
jgi:hypothetical protein